MGKSVATPASQWKGKVQVEGAPLPLPSENTALVRQITPQAFLSSGLIPDPLRPIIQTAINSKQGLRPRDTKKMMDDPKLLGSAMELMDRTICYVVIEPEIVMPPKCTECGEYANTEEHNRQSGKYTHRYNEGKRDPELLYADQVDLMDKQFVFQYAMGGVKELEPFRSELDATVGGLQDQQGVQDTPE
jgi:hypothetical protein